MTAAAINRLVAAAHARLDDLEAKLAAAVEPVLVRAGVEAARAFEARVRAVSLTAAGPGMSSRSTMVALKPTAEQAAVLAVAGGFDADTLHITLAYLGETDGPLDAVAAALAPVARHHAPLSGVVGGIGRFDDAGDGAPVILLPDVPGLSELRVAVTTALCDRAVSYSRDHGFLPHMTLLYSTDAEVPATDALGAPLTFAELLIVRGDTEVLPLPLSGPPPLTASAGLVAAAEPPPAWASPYPDEILNVDALAAAIKAKTDPVRNATIETMAGGVLNEFGIDFDVTNPFVAEVMQQSASQVTHIAETTRLNVMRSIRASYDAGLSIPHTAQVIREGMAEASPARARLIARTEMVGAVNGGSLAAVRIVEQHTGTAYKKRWMTAPGAKTPRHHIYNGLDGQTRPLSGQFDVGGYPLSYPGDPNGPPGEVCSCRCALAYDEGETRGATRVRDTVSIGDSPPVPAEMVARITDLGLEQWPPAMGAAARRLLRGNTDTVGLHSKDGVWDESRADIHERISASFFQGKVAAPGKPTAYMTAGGSASGKSRAVFDVDGHDVPLSELRTHRDVVHIDPDEIKKLLPEYQVLRDAKDFYAASAVHEESSVIARSILLEAQKRGLSVVLDTTGSSGKFMGKVAAARDAGYEVKVTMFSAPTNEAIVRSMGRGDRTGRYVAISPLKYAHAGSAKQMLEWTKSKLVSEWRVYDTSTGKAVLVARGRRGRATVLDPAAYAAIQAKAKELRG